MNRLWQFTALLLAGMLAPGLAFGEDADDVGEGYRETMKLLNRTRLIEPENISRDLQIFKLSDNLLVHRSYFDLGGQRIHANGMLLINDNNITVIDTPWTPSASFDLLDWIDSNHPGSKLRLVITHAHDDRMGGLDPFAERSIPAYSKRETAELAREQGWTAPNFIFEDDLALRSGDLAIELFHPGPGHSADNIVVWFPHEKILFGGCMIKSLYAESLGYTGDADLKAWPNSLRRALARYPDARRVVPGHGLPGDTDLIDRTLELLED